ncbi:MAG: arginase family protein, partial [Candidatus Margulisiibacteriota bacterium]
MPAAHFLEIEPSFRAYASSHFVVVPVPHEATTSYGKGTKKGPAAILSASQQVETFDEELQTEPYKRGIHTLKPVKLAKLQSQITKLLDDNKFPVILGGEH